MKSQPDRSAVTAVHVVGDLDDAGPPVEVHGATVRHRRFGRAVSVVFCLPAAVLPAGRRLEGGELRAGVADPHGRAARDGLVPAVHLQRVVTDRGAEVAPELRGAGVAVRAGVGEDIGPVVADFDGQGIGVRMGRDRQEPVRPAIAAAPDLGTISRARPEDRDPRVVEMPWPAGRPVEPGATLGQRRQQRARDRWPDVGPPLRGAEDGASHCQQRLPPVAVGRVHDQGAAVIAIPLARRPQAAVQARGRDVEHLAEKLPGRIGQRPPGGVTFQGRDQAKLCHQAVIVKRELAVHSAGKGIAREFLLQQPG